MPNIKITDQILNGLRFASAEQAKNPKDLTLQVPAVKTLLKRKKSEQPTE